MQTSTLFIFSNLSHSWISLPRWGEILPSAGGQALKPTRNLGTSYQWQAASYSGEKTQSSWQPVGIFSCCSESSFRIFRALGMPGNPSFRQIFSKMLLTQSRFWNLIRLSVTYDVFEMITSPNLFDNKIFDVCGFREVRSSTTGLVFFFFPFTLSLLLCPGLRFHFLLYQIKYWSSK